MSLLWQLFTTFFKIGAFTIGGGYAMIPLIQRDVVEKHGWETEEEFLDMLAIAECTPGPVAVNTATYVGYKKAGMFGVIAATLGVVLPSFLIILLVAVFLWEYRNNETVLKALRGIRISVVSLIAYAFYKMIKKQGVNIKNISIIGTTLFLILYFTVSPIWIIILAAFIAIVVNKRKESGEKNE